MKPTDLIDRLIKENATNLDNTWVIIDSEELDLTGKMNLRELATLLGITIP